MNGYDIVSEAVGVGQGVALSRSLKRFYKYAPSSTRPRLLSMVKKAKQAKKLKKVNPSASEKLMAQAEREYYLYHHFSGACNIRCCLYRDISR